MSEAAGLGIAEAPRFAALTPREIALTLEAHSARLLRALRDSWELGRLLALAVHAPDKLPPPPAAPLPDMTDDDMKRRLLAWRGKEPSHDPG